MITWRAALDPDNHVLEMRHMGYDASAKHVATVDGYKEAPKGAPYYSASACAITEWQWRSFYTIEEARAWCEKVVAKNTCVWREATQAEMDRAKAQFIPAEQVTRSPFLDADREARRKKWLHLRAQAKVWKETACRLAREVAEGTPAAGDHWQSMYMQQQADTAVLRGEVDALREGAKKLRECLDAKDAKIIQLSDRSNTAVNEMTRMNWKLADANTEVFRLREDNVDCREIKKELELLRAAVPELRTDLDRRASEIANLRSRLAKAQENAVRLDNQHDEDIEKAEALVCEAADLRVQLERKDAEIKRLTEWLEHLRGQFMSASQNSTMVKGMLDEEVAKNKELTAKIAEIYRDMFGSVSGGAE